MRSFMRALFSSLLVAAVVLSPLLHGCGSDDGFHEPDAGQLVDAGSDGGSQPDAGDDDAGTDAGDDAGTDAGEDAGTDAGEDAGTDAGEDGGTDAGEEWANIRVLAANLTSGNAQSYDPGHGTRLMQGVQPDVILIQEFDYGDKSEAAVAAYVERTFPGFDYYREPRANGYLPNGVISRWPIISAGKWEDSESPNREFVWARIDIPGPIDLWAVSLHLLTRNASTRRTEAQQLVGYIQERIPEDDYLIVGGDLNTDSRSEAAFSSLAAIVDVSGPHPADHNGNPNTNASRAKPYDHVFADPDLRPYQVPTVIGASTFQAGLVLDSRVYSPLTEIAPALSGDSGATNMQHMGVVKDFRVPAN